MAVQSLSCNKTKMFLQVTFGSVPYALTKAAYQMNPIVLIMSSLKFLSSSATMPFSCCLFIVASSSHTTQWREDHFGLSLSKVTVVAL